MRPIEIGLVNTTGRDISMVAATTALNIQVTKHLRRCWDTTPAAFVRHYKKAEDIPFGTWQVQLVEDLREHGFHSTDHYQPYAKINASDEDWTIAASHEILEMLVDPSGNRLQIARAVELADAADNKSHVITDGHAEVGYLMEVCDPCEAHSFAYQIEGVWVSDFITPEFYDCSATPGTRYSFRHNIPAPRRILPGGYITWVDPNSGDLQQMIWPGEQNRKEINPVRLPDGTVHRNARDRMTNLRSFVDASTHERARAHRGAVRKPPYRGTIDVGGKTEGTPHEAKAHWVTYRQDGVIERRIEDGNKRIFTCVEEVKAHEPILRQAGTIHIVRNLGSQPLLFEKDGIPQR